MAQLPEGSASPDDPRNPHAADELRPWRPPTAIEIPIVEGTQASPGSAFTDFGIYS
jgi:hypothetical protein